MMLRASQLASPVLCAITQSLIPTLNLSSSSSLSIFQKPASFSSFYKSLNPASNSNSFHIHIISRSFTSPKGFLKVPEFEEVAFTTPLNKVARCKTKFGWHLLQVLSEREASLLQDIQPDELHKKMQDPNFHKEAQLIDVREPEEVALSSLPGFQVLPLRQFGSWGPDVTAKFDPQKDTYVMCHHGMRSLQVAQWLQTQGFRRVFNVSGGIHAYATKVDPSIPTY
ncbi:hypothetical protein CICLE_v10017644mg [Citrus x clementina]|uniref:Rhodanese domain-containing protein n=1 Tax=Citrus clementina TaxID=85681 RepID=V4TGP8_CITCL|nr:hypothetical protein CICLE_v10017644mg [Citrus x clementina]